MSPAWLRYLYLAIGGLAVLWLALNAGRLAGLWTRNMAFLSANRAYAVREATGQMDPVLTERGITSLQRTAAHGAANDSTWRVMGYLHLSQGEEAQALAAWQHTQVSAVELLGNGQKAEADGATEEALTWYMRAVEVDPGVIPAWEGAGLIYESRADWPAAIALYERAITANPRNSDLLYHLGRVIGQATWPVEWATILQLAEHAISNNAFLQDWNRRQTHLMRANALRSLGRPMDALNEYQWVLAQYPDEYWAALGRAEMTWYALGDAPAAEKLLLEVIASDPGSKWGYRGLAEFYAATGRIDEARPLFEHVLELDPDDFAATRWLAQN